MQECSIKARRLPGRACCANWTNSIALMQIENVNQPISFTVKAHFDGKDATVRQIYDRLLKDVKKFGRVVEDPKKTSIHLVNKTAFAGVATRNSAIILTIKSEDRLLKDVKKFGRVVEDPKKTSIHLVNKTAFAGVATRNSAIILTIKS